MNLMPFKAPFLAPLKVLTVRSINRRMYEPLRWDRLYCNVVTKGHSSILIGNGKMCNCRTSFLQNKTTLRLSSMTDGACLPVVFIFGHVSALVLFLSFVIFVKNYLSLCRYCLHPIQRHYFVIVLITVAYPTLDV